MAFEPPIEPRLPLLPLDEREWDWKRFERFCLDLVNALPDVSHADFHGTQGDKQDGIDILAQLTDGRQRTYQCKKHATFGPKRAEDAVKANVFVGADEHVLLVSCITSVKTQKYVAGQPHWRSLDKEGISAMVRTQLDRETARRIVEDHLGAPVRRAFLGPEGPMTFVDPTRYFQPFERVGLFRHSWQLVGRAEELDVLTSALSEKRVVVLPGRGGIGKTRLLRELTGGLADDRVLIAVDDVTITPQAAEDLPLTSITVVVDDVHRRDDLSPLLAELVRRQEPTTLLLATRPQRLEELRGELARVGYESDDIFVADALGDLDISDTEALARQALGPSHQRYAAALAEATADCPLVTAVGGQLLASRAVDPKLLERQQDFRDVVLSRWQEEIVGNLSPSVDPDIAQGALRLVAALAPLSVEGQAIGIAAAELGVSLPILVTVLGELEQAGLLLARGRLRRIIPDVLADHILHRACLDLQGRPTGYADALVNRYAEIAFTELLRNLAELDWRIGQTAGASRLLERVWVKLSADFERADAEGRVNLLNRLAPAAIFAPEEILEIIELALREPAQPSKELFGLTMDDASVRRELPPLLHRVGLHPNLTAKTMSLLWELGRDDRRPLHANLDHPIRIATELGEYGRSSTHPAALLALTEQLLGEGQGDGYYWSPLEMLRPLVARTVTRTSMVGFGVQIRDDYVIAEATSALRRRVLAVISEQALLGSARTQYLAADLYGAALQIPSPPGGAPPAQMIDQWHDEELHIVRHAAELIDSGTPLLRMELRTRLSRYLGMKKWPDVVEAIQAALAAPVDAEEQMLTVFGHSFDLGDSYENTLARHAEFGKGLAADTDPDKRLAAKLNEAVAQLDATRQLQANPLPALAEMATRNPRRGLAIATWLIEHPDQPLARFAGAVLSPLRTSLPEELETLLGRLDGGDLSLRRQLAGYLQGGTWSVDPSASDINRLRRLLRDEDIEIRNTAIHTLLPLTKVNLPLAVELALDADTSLSQHADLIDHVLSEGLPSLEPDQLDARLQALECEPRLSWSSWQLLLGVGSTHPQKTLDVLIARAHADMHGMRPISEARDSGDVLAGFDDTQYMDALRAVRQATLTTDQGSVRRTLGEVFWALDRDENMWLEALGEWLTLPDLAMVKAAARLLDPLPFAQFPDDQDQDRGHQLLLDHADDLSCWLDAASLNGEEHAAIVREALMMVLTGGVFGRTLGESDQHHLTRRERAQTAADARPAGSLSRAFWMDLVRRFEQSISEAKLEDEEFPEGHR
jgi:hypothetical protein